MHSPPSPHPLRQIALALLATVVMALIGAVGWSIVPIQVATMLGADEEVAMVFVLMGLPAGMVAGGVSGLLATLLWPRRRTWRRYLVVLLMLLATGVLFGLIWSDFRCASCF